MQKEECKKPVQKRITVKVEGHPETIWGWLWETADGAHIEMEAVDYNNNEMDPRLAGYSIPPALDTIDKIILNMTGHLDLQIKEWFMD